MNPRRRRYVPALLARWQSVWKRGPECQTRAERAEVRVKALEAERKEYIHKSATDNGRISKLQNLVLERAAERDEMAARVAVMGEALKPFDEDEPA